MKVDGENNTIEQQQRTQTHNPSSEMGRDAFMKLLVAQLRNQDPLDPMDSRDFIAQLSQLTSVEKLIEIEGRLQDANASAQEASKVQSSALIGKQVVADSSSVRISDFGSADLHFDLEAPASDVTVSIRDAEGNEMRTLSTTNAGMGPQSMTWDGRNMAGERLPAGEYHMVVSATGEGGQEVLARNRVSGLVEGVSYEGGEPALIIGGAQVSFSDLLSVSQ